MARTTDTRALTEQAFWELLSAARKPTIQAVQEWLLARGLTRRNNNTIGSALDNCWEQLGARLSRERSAPEFPDDVVELVLTLRNRMLDVAGSAFEEDRERLLHAVDAARNEAQEHMHDCEQASQALQLRLNETQTALAAALATLEERDMHIAALETQIDLRPAPLPSTDTPADDQYVEELQQRLSVEQTRHAGELSAAEARCEATRAELQHARDEVARLRAALDKVAPFSDVDSAAEGRYAPLPNDVKTLQGRVIQRELELERLSEEFAQLEDAFDQLAAQLAVAQARASDFESRPRYDVSFVNGNIFEPASHAQHQRNGNVARTSQRTRRPQGGEANGNVAAPGNSGGGGNKPSRPPRNKKKPPQQGNRERSQMAGPQAESATPGDTGGNGNNKRRRPPRKPRNQRGGANAGEAQAPRPQTTPSAGE